MENDKRLQVMASFGEAVMDAIDEMGYELTKKEEEETPLRQGIHVVQIAEEATGLTAGAIKKALDAFQAELKKNIG